MARSLSLWETCVERRKEGGRVLVKNRREQLGKEGYTYIYIYSYR